MKLLLVRHGETVENSKGIIQGHLPGKLSDKGVLQAKKLGLRLKNEKIDAIYSSDLFRAVETCNEISVFHNDIPINFTEELREVDMGVNQGKTNEELDWKRDFKTNYIAPEGGESTEELYDRAERFLQYLLDKYEDKTVLVVTHGGTIKAFLSVLFGISKAKVFSVDYQQNTGLSFFEIDNKFNHKTILLNNIEHLNK